MDFWNYIFICIGIGMTIGTILRDISGFRSEKYFRKLELKYGCIDRKKTLKLDKIFNYILAIGYILIGILTRNMVISIIGLITVSIIITLGYYLIRKKYIIS